MEAQYRQIFDSTSAGIFVLDREGRLINGNPTVLKVIGGGVRDLRQLRGQDFLDLVFARPERARAMIDAGGAAQRDDVGRPRAAFDGRPIALGALPAVGAGGESPPVDRRRAGGPGGVIEGVLYDITERKDVETDVRRRAEHDALTGASTAPASTRRSTASWRTARPTAR